MSSKGRRHPHKYYRVKLPGQYPVWACALEDCSHHMPRHYESLLLHKSFECWNCGEQGKITQEHLDLNSKYFTTLDDVKFPSHPICMSCIIGIQFDEPGPVKFEDVDAILDSIRKDKVS